MNGTRIFIKNLALNTKEQDINEIFGKFGEVTKIDLKAGFGFIYYAHADDAADAIKSMNDREVDGKVITVEIARDDKKKPIKRLDLRLSVSGVGSGVSWQDLKDWAREAGDVTFTNVFIRDGQNFGVVEFQDAEGMENGLRILEPIPLKGTHVRLEKDATAFDSRSNGVGRSYNRDSEASRAYPPRGYDDDRGRPFDDRDPRGGGYRGDPRGGYDSRGSYPGGDHRDRERGGYPPHGVPHHFDGPPRGYDDRDHRGPHGDSRGRYSEDYRRGPPPMHGPPQGYYPPSTGRSRSRSRDRGDGPRGGAAGGGYWPGDYRGAGPPGGGGYPPPRSYSDAPPDRRGGGGGYDGPPSRGGAPPPGGARYYEGGRGGSGYDSRGPPR